jgi:uncharacterized phiE125 gp8 family phage protein
VIFGSPVPPTVTLTPYRSLTVAVKPVVEPVSVSEAKSQARIDADAEDALVASYITMAREWLEGTLDISLISQTLEARYDLFPVWEIVLPKPPMAAGTVTITYRDGNGATQTLSSASGHFQTDHRTTPGRVYPNYSGNWPVPRGDENSVTVRWPAGYGPTGFDCPATARGVIMLLVAHWFEMRQPVVTGYSQVLPVPKTVETLVAATDWGAYR